MSISSKIQSENQVTAWTALIKEIVQVTLAYLKSYSFSNFASNRNQRIDNLLDANNLFRKSASSVGNNCLLDTIFQQIRRYLEEPCLEDFVGFVRGRTGQTEGQQLSINDEEQGVQLLSAVQAYLQRSGFLCHFDLTVLLADNEGGIGYVEMDPITSTLPSHGELVPIRMIVVNYNHYEPVFEKGKEGIDLEVSSSQYPLKQEIEAQKIVKAMENSPPRLTFLNPFPKEGSQGLKPLAENPLVQFTNLAFGLNGIKASDFFKKYPEWSEALNHGYTADPRDGKGYISNLQRFKKKLGIPESEEGVGEKKKHLIKIEEAVHEILKVISKKGSDLEKLQRYIHTIRDSAYELFIAPEKDILGYVGTPFNIFMLNEQKFRSELRKITGGDPSQEALSERILDSVRQGKISEEKEYLLKEFRKQEEAISRLAETAEHLFLEAVEKALREVKEYEERPEVRVCYEWFLSFPDLLVKYQMLRDGRCTSLADIPQGPVYSDKIDYPSYLPQLSDLIVACQRLQKGDFDISTFEEYRLSQAKYRHLQETLVPLSFFLEVIDRILLWPQSFEPSEGEWEFLRISIMRLMVIANKNLPGSICISYEYLSLSDDKVKSEAALLRKKETDSKRKRKACRYLYHSRIPWKALRAVGNLTHRSGGVPEKDANDNDLLLRTAIVDFVEDLPQVREALCALIEFELREFDSEPFIQPPKEFLTHYPGIKLLGNFEESRAHLKECLEKLGHWDNRILMADDFSSPKVQSAILRTIQLQGEVTKNIRDIGVLGIDPIWDLFEEIRDILSHSERVQTEKRLKELLEEPKNYPILTRVLEDFRTIREFLQERFRLLNKCNTWKERLGYLDSGAQLQTYLELPGLESFFIFLSNKISIETQANLQKILVSDQARGARFRISTIVKEFLGEKFDQSTYKSLVKLLPLTAGQKKEVESGIKLSISPKAAVNDSRDAKPSMLKASVSIANDLLKNRRGNYPRDELGLLLEALNEIKDSIGKEEFRDKVLKARSIFQKLNRIWKQRSLPRGKIDVMEENLANLTEDVEGYLNRKKERLFSILRKIPVNLSDSEVEKRGTSLINNMQLGRVSASDLGIFLHELGVQGEEKKAWEGANKCCLAKKKAPPLKEDEKNEDSELRQIQRLIEKIQNRIKRLDQLMIHQSLGEITKDPILLLACQYLISDFRSAASNLELSLESMKHTIAPGDFEFIQELQCNLLFCMENGNDILHAHDISEPGIMTPHGRKFYAQQNAASLIYNFSRGENRNVLIESLFSKLQRLRKIFSL